MKLGTIILERGAFQASQNGRAALATSSLCHHKDSTVRVQRRLEPNMQCYNTDCHKNKSVYVLSLFCVRFDQWIQLTVITCNLFPRPSTPPVFDRLQYAKTEGEGLGNFITWSAARPSNIVTPPLNSQVIYKTDLAFCASYKDGTSASRELHQAHETYPGNKPRLRKATEWRVKIPSSDAIISRSKKTALFGVAPLISQQSLSSYMYASNPDMFYR